MSFPNGARLRSACSDAEVIVVRATAADLTCGGHPLVPRDVEVDLLAPLPGLDDLLLLGKRYADDASSVELLVTKPGAGTLQASGVTLSLKTAKALPASD